MKWATLHDHQAQCDVCITMQTLCKCSPWTPTILSFNHHIPCMQWHTSAEGQLRADCVPSPFPENSQTLSCLSYCGVSNRYRSLQQSLVSVPDKLKHCINGHSGNGQRRNFNADQVLNPKYTRILTGKMQIKFHAYFYHLPSPLIQNHMFIEYLLIWVQFWVKFKKKWFIQEIVIEKLSLVI